VEKVLATSRTLNEFPERGRVVPELADPNVRELFVKEYRLVYSIEKSRIIILGLIHGKRELKKLWGKEQRGNRP
jgi:plasmid stabilization system protein ParE